MKNQTALGTALAVLTLAATVSATERPVVREENFRKTYGIQTVTLDPARLKEFLDKAVARASVLPPEDGFELLRSSAEMLLDKSQFTHPLGVSTTVRAILYAGSEASTYGDGSKIVVQGFTAAAERAAALSGEPDEFFPAFMASARAAALGVAPKNGYVALRGFMSAANIFPDELIPTPILRFTIASARKASDRPCSDAEGYEVLDAAMASMEANATSPDRSVFLNAAIPVATRLGPKSAYRVLRLYTKKLLKSDFLVDAYDKVTLKTALGTSWDADTYEASVTILKDALASLL